MNRGLYGGWPARSANCATAPRTRSARKLHKISTSSSDSRWTMQTQHFDSQLYTILSSCEAKDDNSCSGSLVYPHDPIHLRRPACADNVSSVTLMVTYFGGAVREV